ncbi:hypothetical protein CE457_06130 [Vreelandella boliviensis LC1]|uniref:AraC-type transcription regulator ligand-binding domain-containing protein n=1 Tax=Vreelandella boliviensis LC1 TaxID=1072583 RepID=A0ABX4GBE4_9GAMM|nr:hypothetical protein CE457_06130 [Halomonas boliviensis LC1]
MDHDFLSEMLRSVRLSGAVFFEVDVAAPWVVAAPPKGKLAQTVVSGAHAGAFLGRHEVDVDAR